MGDTGDRKEIREIDRRENPGVAALVFPYSISRISLGGKYPA